MSALQIVYMHCKNDITLYVKFKNDIYDHSLTSKLLCLETFPIIYHLINTVMVAEIIETITIKLDLYNLIDSLLLYFNLLLLLLL